MHREWLVLISSLIALLVPTSDGQSTETVRQKSDKSPCSNIVAKGNVTNNCANTAQLPLSTPVIHLEPRSGIFRGPDAGTKTVYTITIDNTGLEAISNVRVSYGFFVARRYPEVKSSTIRVYHFGPVQALPNDVFPSIASHRKVKFRIDFADATKTMKELFETYKEQGLIWGVRILVEYERARDGMDYKFVTIDQAVYLQDEGVVRILTLDDTRNEPRLPAGWYSISLKDLMPLIVNDDDWIESVFYPGEGKLKLP